MRRLQDLSISALLAAVLWTGDASACSCGTVDRAEAFRRAVLVFAGEVVSMPERQFEEGQRNRQPGYDVVFELIELWKGAAPAQVELFTGNGYGDCGYGFHPGKRYLVYAYQTKDVFSEREILSTNICSPTSSYQPGDHPPAAC